MYYVRPALPERGATIIFGRPARKTPNLVLSLDLYIYMNDAVNQLLVGQSPSDLDNSLYSVPTLTTHNRET